MWSNKLSFINLTLVLVLSACGSDSGTTTHSDGKPTAVEFNPAVIDDEIADVAFQAIKVLQHLSQYYDRNPITLGIQTNAMPRVSTCTTDKDGLQGNETLIYTVTNAYSIEFDNCYLNQSNLTSGQFTYVTGTIDSNDLQGSQVTSVSQTQKFTDLKFEWESGILTINGTMRKEAGEIVDPVNLTIKHEDTTHVAGQLDPKFTDIYITGASLNFSIASNSTPKGETFADITLTAKRYIDSSSLLTDTAPLHIETIEPLIDLRDIPTAGVVKISENNTNSSGIVTIVDRDEVDPSHWVEVEIDYDGDGSLNGIYDEVIADWWRWRDFDFE